MPRKVVLGFVLLLSCLALVVSIAALVGGIKPASLNIGPKAPAKATAAVRSSTSGSSAASAVELAFTANEALAKSAPQQQVVAGWAIKDALEGLLRQSDVVAQQNADLSTQLADATNLLATRADSLTSLLTAIALASISVAVAAVVIAISVLWSGAATAATFTRAAAADLPGAQA